MLIVIRATLVSFLNDENVRNSMRKNAERESVKIYKQCLHKLVDCSVSVLYIKLLYSFIICKFIIHDFQMY